MNRKLIPVGLLSSAFFVVLAPCAVANTAWYVDGMNGSDSNNCLSPSSACKTIGHAISLASSGDSIIVAPATYTENLTIGISLNVIGSGARTTIIDGGGVQRVVRVSSGNVTLAGLTIRNGFTSGGGAGIANSGNLLVISSTITENLAYEGCQSRNLYTKSWAQGGGIFNMGKLTISQSTIAGNTAKAQVLMMPCIALAQGGGIHNEGTLIISNSTIEGNTAQHVGFFASGRGGGISNGGISGNGTVTISSSTITGNTADSASSRPMAGGGGIQGSATLQNSVISNNSGSNCYGTMKSNGYNLSSDGTCNFNSRGDLNDQNPLLGPLQNNGGPTDTMALLPGSPAIDAGNPSGCTDDQGNLLKTDQRGMPRPDKEDSVGCDMGAFESQSD